MLDEPTPAPTLTYESPRWVATPAADLGAIGLRLLGVKLVVDVIGQVPLAISMLAGGFAGGPWIGFAIYAAWNLAIAAALLAFAGPTAGAVFGRRRATVADLGPASWMTLIVAGAGVAYAIFAVGDLLTLLARWYAAGAAGRPTFHWVDAFLPLAKPAVGLLLFFKPSLLVSPWLRSVAPLTPARPAS